MGEAKHTKQELMQWQALPLNVKILMTKRRIRDWVNYYGQDGVYVSFSGGKDSTVLLHMVREEFPRVPGVFVDTGLEYPEIREFVKTFDNIEWLKPKMNFRQVIENYGYPFISKEVAQRIYDVTTSAKKQGIGITETSLFKRNFDPDSDYCKNFPQFCCDKWGLFFEAPFAISHKCCDVMKKKPSKEYEKRTGRKPFLGTMASESRLRMTSWIKYGCNAFQGPRQKSTPMAFWTDQDVLLYIKKFEIPICSVYGNIVEDRSGTDEVEGQLTISDIEGMAGMEMFDAKQLPLTTTGCKRTGCMFCGYGCHLENPGEGRFEKMKITHPKQYDYIMRPWEQGGLNFKWVIDWINEHGNMNIRY